MSIWLILFLAWVGWLIAPGALRLLGAVAVALGLLVLVVGPDGATMAGAALVVTGVLMLSIGSIWRAHRREGTCTAASGWMREHAARAILGINPNGRIHRWLAYRIAWRLPRWQVEALYDEADRAAAPEQHMYTRPPDARERSRERGTPLSWMWGRRGDANGSDVEEPSAVSREDEEHTHTLREWFDAEHPPRTNLKTRGGGHPEWWELGAPPDTLRGEMSRTLEDIRRHLEVIIHIFFWEEVGPDWVHELKKRRTARLGRKGWPTGYDNKRPVGCRPLFSVIAEDWTMIGACFMRDPSPAAKNLLATLDQYNNEMSGAHRYTPTPTGMPLEDGLRHDDPALASEAFQEILAAIRPQARGRLTDQFSAARVAHETREREYAQGRWQSDDVA